MTNGPEGAYPRAGLVLSGNILYGTTEHGGTNTFGTVFKVGTDGEAFTILHAFTNGLDTNYGSDGAYPAAGLILSGDTLYGMAHSGGDWGYGIRHLGRPLYQNLGRLLAPYEFHQRSRPLLSSARKLIGSREQE